MPDRCPLPREEVLRRLNVRATWYVGALAHLLTVHPSTVYRWIYEGKLRAERRGPHQTLIASTDIREFLDGLQEAAS
jgi:excisionase family DNA binding protein